MLGMMNCPTNDNVEFYSASPSSRRAILEHDSSAENSRHNSVSNSSSNLCGKTNEHNENPTSTNKNNYTTIINLDIQSSTNNEDEEFCESVRIFSEVRDKPQITYTKDGRKMIDGKLEENEVTGEKSDPNKMWDRLIMTKMALRSSEKVPEKMTKLVSASRKRITNEASNKIEPATPITVTAVKNNTEF